HDDCPLCVTHHDNTQDDTDCCDEDGCEQSDATLGGCQNVKVEAKKTTEEHLPGNEKTNLLKIFPQELVAFVVAWIADFPRDSHTLPLANNSPPSLSAVPLFIQHCTYRI